MKSSTFKSDTRIEDLIQSFPLNYFHEGAAAELKASVRSARSLPENQNNRPTHFYVPGDGTAREKEFNWNSSSQILKIKDSPEPEEDANQFSIRMMRKTEGGWWMTYQKP